MLYLKKNYFYILDFNINKMERNSFRYKKTFQLIYNIVIYNYMNRNN
ncbi:hypothetical protein M8044_000082 [Columbia Basin potato purple top phytoplasma]|uniref:Uncharacterized protein n=1 Tax=Columbia Basin potato purple top phytoplasma TaxID=307134 RepID=A0ABT5LAW0_9MOLU|nr:hypothetical protein [Columbia Basin potato purple top phytoplasma]